MPAGPKVCRQFGIGHRLKVVNLLVALVDHVKSWRLHPANGINALDSLLAQLQGKQGAAVHPDQPVADLTGLGFLVAGKEVPAVSKILEAFPNGALFQRVDPQAVKAFFPGIDPALTHDGPGNILPFPVAVSRHDDRVSLFQQGRNDLELLLLVPGDEIFVAVRKNWQVLHGPALVFRVIGLGHGQFHQVAKAISNNRVARQDRVCHVDQPFTLFGLGKGFGIRAGLAGLFRQNHCRHQLSSLDRIAKPP